MDLSFASHASAGLAAANAPPLLASQSSLRVRRRDGTGSKDGLSASSLRGNSQARGIAGVIAVAVPALFAATAASGKRRLKHHRQRLSKRASRREGADGVVVPLRRHAQSDPKVPLFSPWVDWLCQHFVQELQLEEEPLPRHLAYREGQSEAFLGRSVQTRILVSKRTDSPVRYLRVTLVNNGQQFQALNAAVYPSFSRGPLPMLAIDLLSFDTNGRQLFGIDWAPMWPTEEYSAEHIAPYIAEVRHGERAHLTCQPTARFYGENPEFFSPHIFFARPQDAGKMRPGGDLWDVFVEYCSRYTSMLQSAPSTDSRDSASKALERQVAYEEWHYEHDPAPKLLNRVFGDDWTQQFMEQCMFPAHFKQHFYGVAALPESLGTVASPE